MWGRRRGPKVPLRERYRVSKAILGQSFRLVFRERRLWVFPAVSATLIVGLIVAAGFAANALGVYELAARGGAGSTLAALLLFLILLPLAYPLTLLVALTQTAYVYALHERLAGRLVHPRAAWSQALGRLGTLARFNLVAMLVAGVLQVVGVLLEKLRLVPYLGQFVQTMGLFGWTIASFFVIPIIAVERETSALAAFRSSANLARAQWGKSVAGLVTISLALVVPVLILTVVGMVAMLVGAAVLVVYAGKVATLVWLLAWAAVLAVGLLATMFLQSAATPAYQTALYRYARTGQVPAPFTRETVVDAWAPYRQP